MGAQKKTYDSFKVDPRKRANEDYIKRIHKFMLKCSIKRYVSRRKEVFPRQKMNPRSGCHHLAKSLQNFMFMIV